MLYSYAYTCEIITTTIITSDTVLRKIYLSLYLKGLCVRGSWRPNRTAIYLPPLLWPSAFLSSLLNRRPGDAALCRVLAFSTVSCLQTRLVSKTAQSGVPRAPSAGCCFLFSIIFQLSILQNWLNFLCTELYNSSIAHWISPHNWPLEYALPPSLEWHVWSSSNGNNCHAVHRSLSSGASVCDYTVGF